MMSRAIGVCSPATSIHMESPAGLASGATMSRAVGVCSPATKSPIKTGGFSLGRHNQLSSDPKHGTSLLFDTQDYTRDVVSSDRAAGSHARGGPPRAPEA